LFRVGGELLENPHLSEVWLGKQLSLYVIFLLLEINFFFYKHSDRLAQFWGLGLAGFITVRKHSKIGHSAQVLVSRGEDDLLELFDIECAILSGVELPDNFFSLSVSDPDVILFQILDQVFLGQEALALFVQLLEGFVRHHLGMHRKLLSHLLDFVFLLGY